MTTALVVLLVMTLPTLGILGGVWLVAITQRGLNEMPEKERLHRLRRQFWIGMLFLAIVFTSVAALFYAAKGLNGVAIFLLFAGLTACAQLPRFRRFQRGPYWPWPKKPSVN